MILLKKQYCYITVIVLSVLLSIASISVRNINFHALFSTPDSLLSQYRENRFIQGKWIASSYEKYFTKTNYLDLSSILNDLTVTKVLPLPPQEESKDEFSDEFFREQAITKATLEEMTRAKKSQDNVFAYSYILGSHFNPQELPKTALFFQKIDTDLHLAVHVAKNVFSRKRPITTKPGYAYPSGHSSRAFLWESLLAEAVPEYAPQLYTQAKTKAWNRVVLGRHYPADIVAGESYGYYLTKKFHKNPEFQKEWEDVKEEIRTHVINNMASTSLIKTKQINSSSSDESDGVM